MDGAFASEKKAWCVYYATAMLENVTMRNDSWCNSIHLLRWPDPSTSW